MSIRRHLRFTAALGALLMSACGAGPLAYVRDRAEKPVSCTEMSYERVGETGLVYATGCGEIVRYVAQCNPMGLCLGATHEVVSQSLRRQAGFDLGCEDQMAISKLGPGTFGVAGCGRRVSYTLLCNPKCRILQNTQSQ
jgi:hypothetical protein